MSGWDTPPIAVAVKPVEQVKHTILVYPIDHARTVEYVALLWDQIIRECADLPTVVAVLQRNRQRMIDQVIPDPKVPSGFVRFTSGETQFIEIALNRFYVGLEDRKNFPEDIRRLKAALALSF